MLIEITRPSGTVTRRFAQTEGHIAEIGYLRPDWKVRVLAPEERAAYWHEASPVLLQKHYGKLPALAEQCGMEIRWIVCPFIGLTPFVRGPRLAEFISAVARRFGPEHFFDCVADRAQRGIAAFLNCAWEAVPELPGRLLHDPLGVLPDSFI